MQEKRSIHLWPEIDAHYAMSQALRVGDTIYVAGTVALDETGGGIVGEHDMEAQTRQAYANIARSLAPFGATLAHVVEDVLFLTDMSRSAEALEARVEAYAGCEHPPASTMVEVSRLAVPQLLVEIKATARCSMIFIQELFFLPAFLAGDFLAGAPASDFLRMFLHLG